MFAACEDEETLDTSVRPLLGTFPARGNWAAPALDNTSTSVKQAEQSVTELARSLPGLLCKPSPQKRLFPASSLPSWTEGG